MSDIRVTQSNYVRFELHSEGAKPIKLNSEPIGWSTNDIELSRHKGMHGMLVQFTGDLSFYGNAMEYIEQDKLSFGINSNLKLKKFELIEVGGVVKWNLTYIGFIDYSTYSKSDEVIKVKFNSNQLENLIETRMSDEFDLERELAIDETQLEKLQTNLTGITGVSLFEENVLKQTINESLINDAFVSVVNGVQQVRLRAYATISRVTISPILELTKESGNSRISSPDTVDIIFDEASRMFYVDAVNENEFAETDVNVDAYYDVDVNINVKAASTFQRRWIYLEMSKYIRDDVNLEYDLIDTAELHKILIPGAGDYNFKVNGYINSKDIKYNEGLILGFRQAIDGLETIGLSTVNEETTFSINSFKITASVLSKKEPTEDHEFVFVHDAINRLINIITGNKNRFISRLFGRTEKGYTEDGRNGLIGLISGHWVRKFTPEYPLYNSMVLSLEDIFDSLKAVFNIGIGIEVVDGVQKVIIEDLEYFYQRQIVINLEEEISQQEITVRAEDHFSSLEIGYNKGGDYDDLVGEEEPNRLTNWITPIIKVENKFRKTSDIRADDVGMELSRKKPANLFPKEDLSSDDHNWFLDLKRVSVGVIAKFIQATWADRLRFKPEDISYAEDFKGMIFTPMTMLRRHGKTIRMGLNQKINLLKTIQLSNSSLGKKVKMHFLGETKSYSENQSILVSDLNSPIVTEETIKFYHPVNDELLRNILGFTKIIYYGDEVSVPNYYFRFQWRNKNKKLQTGFLINLEPRTGIFEMQIANNEKKI